MPPFARLAGLTLLLALPVLHAFAAEPILQVITADKTLAFTAAEFAALPRTELTAIEPHEKKERRYAGVTVRELLTRAGAPLGEKLRGPALTLGVLVRSRDNYTVLYALAEFDEAFSSRTLLLADREDGAPPPASAAPLRLVAPGDKRGARWARMVTSIEVVPLPASR
ncbi:MAG: molybdopterin-dependent oxidoreductase [Verrucomicrobia bacterium]|nr:molybdopterin-dependent oxidoreductase [Verrucomicrobiota bacterium]